MLVTLFRGTHSKNPTDLEDEGIGSAKELIADF